MARREGTEDIPLLGEADEDEGRQDDGDDDIMAQLARAMGQEPPKKADDPSKKAAAAARRKAARARLARDAENGTIHVFSVATGALVVMAQLSNRSNQCFTGHLYERFLRIMMLSVLRNTKNPVKFWLLSNFLSPHCRDVLPKMAAHVSYLRLSRYCL